MGLVSGIGSNPIPLLMKPYQHEDCLAQFQAAFDYIEIQLSQIDMGYESLVFRRSDHELNSVSVSFERLLLVGMNSRFDH